ncbi:MAG: 3-oxo-tetronate kinase [Roseiarcus sp.]
MLLGVVADDLTGAADVALMISRHGMNTVQAIGVPSASIDFGDAEAVVVALKSRTIPAGEAVALSLSAAGALRSAGAEQLLFKYCSTFDSTDEGNIGPVAEALLDLVGSDLTIACPAFPAAGRSIYQGHLFVGDMLLSDSPMKDHPLTPMRDANLVRVLQRQVEGRVGLIPLAIVERGVAAIRDGFRNARAEGHRIVIVDAIHDEHLRVLGAASADMPLVTGGSGVAMGLPDNFRAAGKLALRAPSLTLAAPAGKPVILAGSCSAATRQQVRFAIEAGTPALRLDALAIAAGEMTADQVGAWVIEKTAARPCLVYSSADPSVVRAVQERLGAQRAGAVVEALLADVGRMLLANGFARFLIAGGETSGAVVGALGVTALRIGPEIDPGVPWTRSIGAPDVALALKSGNFGAPDFFLRAWTLLAESAAEPPPTTPTGYHAGRNR